MSPSPEREARQNIDAALEAAGWAIQDRATMNLTAAPGIAVREFKMAKGHGFADYLLFVNGKAVGAGVETRFINGLDPDPKTRAISANLSHIHRPETLAEWIAAESLDESSACTPMAPGSTPRPTTPSRRRSAQGSRPCLRSSPVRCIRTRSRR
jgi:hypothetical protein